MRGFWRIINVILILKIASVYNECQIPKYNDKCHCSRINSLYEMYCPVNSTGEPAELKIEYLSQQYVTISCINNPSLLPFEFNISSVATGVKKLSLKNCNLENIELKDIALLVGAENAETLRIFGNQKDKNITFHKNHFRGFPEMKILEISDNYRSYLDEDLLEFTPHLETLILRNINVESIPKRFFQFVPKLVNIELGNNKIKMFENGTFSNLRNLLLLNIWRNELLNLSSNVFADLESLESINLFSNYLTTLPEDIFDKNVNLKGITLSRNSFTTLPEGLFKNNKKLEILKLQGEQKLTTLSNGLLSNLTNLQVVKLDGCSLKSLSENLFQGSTNLKNISLQKNNLRTLPTNIFNGLKKLEILEINDNQIETLPDNLFDSCVNLKELKISNNNIVTVSKFTFAKLTLLEKLSVERNKITNIDKEAFIYLRRLIRISFAYNNLTHVVSKTIPLLGNVSIFENCEKLEELDLSYNKIQSLCIDWNIYPRNHFKYLDLSHNAITSLTVDDLDLKHNHDFTFDLSYNNITRIDLNNFEERFLEEHRSNIVLNIKNNPLECDCVLYDFLRYLDGSMAREVREKFTIRTGSIKCSGPKGYEGVLLSKLNSKDYKCIPSKMEIVNYEMCPEGCDQWMRPADQTFIFDCSYRNFSQAPATLCSMKDERYFNELDLTGNFITDIPSFQQTGYNQVTSLLLSHNEVSTITKDIFTNTTLKKLKLDNNQITRISPDIIHELQLSLKNVTLGNNPWHCDCETRSFHTFIQMKNNTVEDVDNVICTNLKKMLTRLTVDELCPSKLELIVIASVITAIFGIAFGLFATFYYHYQEKIKIWLYTKNLCLWFVTEAELDKDKLYDAFISYSHKDENFIINELVANLEKGPRSFKLCIHFRDWLVGEWIPNQIAKSIKESKRTIVVVSRNFIESEWGKMEFRAAHKEGLKEGRARVIVIMYGDIGPIDKLEPELKSYLTMNTYVKWGDPWFWNKLRYALPHKSDIIYNISKSKDVNRPNPIAQLSFNKIEVKQSPESGLTPLNGKAKNLWNGNVAIEMNDDESNKLNTIC